MNRFESTRQWVRFALQCFQNLSCRPPETPLPRQELLMLGLASFVHRALVHSGISSPDEFELAEHETRIKNLIKNDRLVELSHRFERAEIPGVALKGSAVVRHLPDYLPARPMADIDLLVPRNRFSEAIDILKELGAWEIERNQPISKHWSSERSFLFSGSPMPLAVDLHRALHHWPLAGKLTRGVIARSILVDGVRIPTAVDCLFIIALHRAKHGYLGDGRELLDFWLLYLTLDEDGWSDLVETAVACDILGGIYALFCLSAAWFGTGSDEENQRAEVLKSRLERWQPMCLSRWIDPRDSLEAQSSWSPLPFLMLYLTMPATTGRILPATVGASLHAVFRLGDVFARGLSAAPTIEELLKPSTWLRRHRWHP